MPSPWRVAATPSSQNVGATPASHKSGADHGLGSTAACLCGAEIIAAQAQAHHRALDLTQPGLADQFRPPATPGQGALLTAVDATLLRLQPQPTDDAATTSAKAALVAKFVAHELPADFVSNLADDRAAIDTAQDAEESSNNDGVESTAAVGLLIRDGMKEMTTLDAIMHNKYARQPEKLRAWQSASHIERAPQREKKPAVSPTAAFTTPPQNKAA
ncbi:MAG: hypothetical protein HY043_13125 [Verrucomicrobia bacterium]|nr:hypothetical protein [Verrucomicrobiota bacterium]